MHCMDVHKTKVTKSETRDRDVISSRPRWDRDVEPSRPRRDRNVRFFQTLETETRLRHSKKRLETKTFKTGTTSLLHLHQIPMTLTSPISNLVKFGHSYKWLLVGQCGLSHQCTVNWLTVKVNVIIDWDRQLTDWRQSALDVSRVAVYTL